jgi:putative transposase
LKHRLELMGRKRVVTAPRRIHSGSTYLVTRRCTQRQFLLRPDARVVQIYLYCLAEAAERFDITLHAWVAMSNHEHLVVRDNHGNLPEFLAHLHRMVAKAMNAHWGRRENFWASEQTNVVFLVQANDRFAKLLYVLANPVAENIVDRVSDWPGASSLGLNLSGRTDTISRPRGFFRDAGRMPKTVTLRTEKLDGFENLSDDGWSKEIVAAVTNAEINARAARAEKKLRVLGRKAVLGALHTDSPTTVEARRTLRPEIACKNPERRARELAALLEFRATHRQAMIEWQNGKHIVAFPSGTYQMRRFVAYADPSVRRAAALACLAS